MIEAFFECQEMSLRYSGVISDSNRFLTVKFNFDDYWEDKVKTAVFSYNENDYLVALEDENSMYLGDDICYIPQEVIKSPGFKISVFGISDGTVITSSKESVSVEKSGYGDNIPVDPTPTEWMQMLEISQNTRNIAQSVRDDADGGLFDGVGVPDGGNTGQILAKNSGSDFDTCWKDIPDSYSKTQSDNKYVPKTLKVNGKALNDDIRIDPTDIGAYEFPDGGIPLYDLSDTVKSKLSKADTALQEHQSLEGYATESWVEDKNYATVSAILNKESRFNKVTELYQISNDTQYPSAKCVYNELQKKQNRIKPYVLRENLTLSESTNVIERNQEPDATPYDYGGIYVKITFPLLDYSQKLGNTFIFANTYYQRAFWMGDNDIHDDYSHHKELHYRCEKSQRGMVQVNSYMAFRDARTEHNVAKGGLYDSDFFVDVNFSVTNLYISSANGFPAGTNIKIYGVKEV